MSLTRRQFLAAAGAALTLPVAARAQAPAATRPNIIFILADDLGRGDIGCYGQQELKTPNLDKLAEEGTVFLNAYSGSMVCAPSRCMLMTGKHPGHATVRNNWEIYPEGQFPLRDSDVTVAQVLKSAGYATGLCGKWGLGGPETKSRPSTKGFDLHFGYNCQRHAHRFYTDYLWRNDERVELPQSPEKRTYAQDPIAREGLKFIREHKDGPFFLYCAWTVPHGGYTVDNVPSIDAFKDKDWPEPQKVYATMVTRLDSDVGDVLALLKELGLEEKTLVIFASDNGAQTPYFGSTMGLRGMKGTLYEGGLRVPLIARWPGHAPAGSKSSFQTAFWDFLPTAAELAGAKAPEGIDGISLAPLLNGGEQPKHKYLYWEQPIGEKKLNKAVRLGEWKGYQDDKGKPVELYDLKTDEGEKKNVAAEHPDVVARIEKIMAEAHVDTEIPKADPRIWEKYKVDNAALDAKLGLKRAPGAQKKGGAKKKAKGKKKA